MEQIVTQDSTTSNKIHFPACWLGNNQRVMYLHEGAYFNGTMIWDLDNNKWRFSQSDRIELNIFSPGLSKIYR